MAPDVARADADAPDAAVSETSMLDVDLPDISLPPPECPVSNLNTCHTLAMYGYTEEHMCPYSTTPKVPPGCELSLIDDTNYFYCCKP